LQQTVDKGFQPVNFQKPSRWTKDDYLMKTRKHCSLAVYTLLAACFFSFVGCSGSRSSGVNRTDESQASAASVSASGTTSQRSSSARPPEYRIGFLDQLEIRFTYHERFNEIATVRPDGRITLQNIGDIYVVGMTPSELDRTITEAYSEFINTPEVTVFVRSFAGHSVYILGEVERPGMVDMKPNMTILQALAAAGGPVRGAKLNSIVVLRKDETGEPKASRFDLNRKAIQEAAMQDERLQPQDIVFVPKTFIANMNEFLSQVYEGLFPPFDIYLRALREYNRSY
jgi:protein involved in polysaccharide export with SLBB domain